MANTTWNPSDKSASVNLTGSNLIATATAASTGVRAVDKQTSGKFYWECRITVWAGANTSVGFCTFGTTMGTVAAPVGECNVIKSGVINVDGSASGSTLAARAANDIIGIALDLDNDLVWLRVAPSGNWNGSATANPATTTGGISIATISGGYPLYPTAAFAGATDSVTANFGDTAFSGTVPSGFTSGFTSGATPAPNALVTQTAAEHWLTTNPDAQATQVALEHWIITDSTTQLISYDVIRETVGSSDGQVNAQGLVREVVRSLTSAGPTGVLAQGLVREVVYPGTPLLPPATFQVYGIAREVTGDSGGGVPSLDVGGAAREVILDAGSGIAVLEVGGMAREAIIWRSSQEGRMAVAGMARETVLVPGPPPIRQYAVSVQTWHW